MSSFKNKTVIVTGAGSGIGRATALLFAEAGAEVAAVDIDAESANGCMREIQAENGIGIAIPCDVTCEGAVSEMVQTVVEKFGHVNYLVCSAGVMVMRSAELASSADWDKCFSTNVKGAALTVRYSSEQMKQQGGGAIVVVSSICGHKPDPGFATYSASKAALLMLTRSMALDYGGSNIRVNAVSPGPVETPGLRAIVQRADADWEQWKRGVAGMQCLRAAMIQPRDIANAILFLCSDEARMITGASLAVDAGLLARSAVM